MALFQHIMNMANAPNMGIPQHLLNTKFDRVFKAVPMSYCPGREHTADVDVGNKVLLPASALEELSRMNIQYPMMFSIERVSSRGPKKKSHCSVLEFTAEEGVVYLPLSMIHNLGLDVVNHSYVKLVNVSLPKGSFARLQPFKMEYVTKLPNQRVILERTLRSYACITKGDIIEIKFADDFYDLEVIELSPANAVSIIETDINVEFAPPKDQAQYEAAERRRKELLQNSNSNSANNEDSSSDEDEFADIKPRTKKPVAQANTGYRLKDGKKADTGDKKQDEFRTEEEIVGDYRFIYKVNVATGERNVIRRLPKGTTKAFSGTGNRLK